MSRLDEVTIDFTYDTYTDLGQGHIEKEKARVTLHLDDQAKQQIKALMLDIIKATEILGPLHPQTSLFIGALRKNVSEL